MKRLFVLSLVAVLSVGLLSVGAFAAQPADAEDSGTTYVEWQIDAPMQCSLDVTAHTGINLGELDEVNKLFWASANGDHQGSSYRKVSVTSNCEYTVQWSAEVSQAPLTESTVLEDFTVNEISGGRWGYGTSNSITDGADYTLGTGGDDTDWSSSDTKTWTMNYGYYTDYDDVNNETYLVNLEYTASTS